MSEVKEKAPKRYDRDFKIDYQTETQKAELHTGGDTYAAISLTNNDVIIEDGKGNSLTLQLSEASMFHQALQFLIQIERKEIPLDSPSESP